MVCIFPRVASAENTLFQEGLAAYQKGDVAESISRWEELSQSAPKDAALWYNLGNAYVQQGLLGRAIAAYERARWIDSNADDILENLTLARRKASEMVSRPLRGEVLQAPTISPARAQQIVVVGVCGFWLCLGLLGVGMIRQQKKQRYLIVGMLCLAVAGLGSFLSLQGSVAKTRAIVVSKEAQVYRGAIETSELVYSLAEGDSVLVEEHRAGWARIRGPQLAEGWVQESAIEAPFASW